MGGWHMFLKQVRDARSGKTHLTMARSYRVKGKKHPQAVTVESFGWLEDLKEQYDDPVAHFKKVVQERNLAEKEASSQYVITARKDQKLGPDTTRRMNYGYIVIMNLFYELGLDGFLTNRRVRESKIECNTSSIMKLLVISRILTRVEEESFRGKGQVF